MDVELRAINKNFGKVKAVNDLSLEIKPSINKINSNNLVGISVFIKF